MLTRLRVKNFKNLVDAEIYFGPFTCIVGENGVGKSNLFDAIQLLSELASGKTPTDAILSIRDGGDVRSVFHQAGGPFASTIELSADLVIPFQGYDQRNAQATATTTFVTYQVSLAWEPSNSAKPDRIKISHESLHSILASDLRHSLQFTHTTDWLRTAIRGDTLPSRHDFISTQQDIVRLHLEGANRNATALEYDISSLPRTLLSTTSVADSPTGLLAKLEMMSWRFIQLEPTALRRPNTFNEPMTLATNGDHLASTLYRLAHRDAEDSDAVYASIGNRLSELIEEVKYIEVDRDDKRDLYTVMATNRDGTKYPASNLSDGTLRFLGLAVLERDTSTSGVLCLEEPENGIHPTRIPAMIRLLKAMAVDTDYEIDQDNPLRQVIVNSHSQLVAQEVDAADLVIAKPVFTINGAQSYFQAEFTGLVDTWREKQMPASPIMGISSYILSPSVDSDAPSKRLIDRPDVQQLRLEFMQ